MRITGQPYVPGQAHGILSRDPRQRGAILVTDRPRLPTESHPAGVVVVNGAPFSHPMLALLARGIPTVIVSTEQEKQLHFGESIALDGVRGTLAEGVTERPVPEPAIMEHVQTADGIAVELCASVRDAADAARARERGAASVGLVRSEFLVPENGRVPDRAYYEQAFDQLAAAAAPLPVTVRLIDIAADKQPAWLQAPALSGQGVRLYAREPLHSVLEAQLAALSVLAARYPWRVLIPYVTQAEEARAWRARIREQLSVPVGAMAETPAAALDVAGLLEVADFVALGLNDLMQCLFGADRDDPDARRYLDPYAPVLYRFLAEVARNAGERVGEVMLCGLLPQLPGVLPVLIGLGFRRFSVDPVFLPWMAERAGRTRSLLAAMQAAKICHAHDPDAVRALLGLGAPSGS